MFDNFNVKLPKHEKFQTSFPCISIPEYGQSNAPLIGSLSTRVIETRTATGREHFACQGFGVSQIFILIISNREKILSKVNLVVWRQVKRENSSLPVAVPVSKPRVLKLPINVCLFSVFTWRHDRHVGAPKQRKGGHVGAPTKSSGNLTLLLCKRFLLFSLKNMAVDHVSENQQ